MSESIQIKEDVGSGYCWKCSTNKVEVNATDSIYRLKCNECYKYRKEKWTLKWMHIRKNKLIDCQFCWNAYEFKNKIEIHKCPMVGNYQCELCAYQLNSSKSLNIHLKIAHGSKESNRTDVEPFKCTICKEEFANSGYLSKHLRTHSEERPFKCTICKKAFTHSGNLSDHWRTHTGERPFQCTICSKAFTQKGNLSKHLRTHTGEKPFECTICKQTFARSHTLLEHSKTHTGEKPFTCTICSKAFAKTGSLARHLKTHNGDRPFKCTICKKDFAQSRYLRDHLRTHWRNTF